MTLFSRLYITLPWCIVDLPAMPVITNVSVYSTSITFNWEQDLSSDVFYYELQYNFTIRECYSEGNTKEWIYVIIDNSSLSSYTLENSSESPVEEDSVYSIILIAVNSDGVSEAIVTKISTQGAGMLTITVLCICIINSSFLVPTGAPKNLRESSINDRIIIIQWEPVECSHRNGEIIGYTVTYYPAGEMLKSIVTYTSDSTFTAMGLVFNTTYMFEVRAINSYGSGPPASATLQTSLTLQGKYIIFRYFLMTLL